MSESRVISIGDQDGDKQDASVISLSDYIEEIYSGEE